MNDHHEHESVEPIMRSGTHMSINGQALVLVPKGMLEACYNERQAIDGDTKMTQHECWRAIKACLYSKIS